MWARRKRNIMVGDATMRCVPALVEGVYQAPHCVGAL